MNNVKDIIADNLSTIREDKDEKVMLDPLSSQLVDQVFVKIALICRGFDTFYADRNRLNAEKTQWILAFSKQGIRHKNQILRALDKLELHRYPNPPQLGEFLEWRTSSPQDLGFPITEQAYKISIQMNIKFSDYKHQDDRVDAIIRHAIKQIGALSYREMKTEQAQKIFKTYYDISIKQFLEGGLKIIPRALSQVPEPHPSDKERSDAARKKAMEAIRGMGIEIKTIDDKGLPNNPI